MRKKKQDLKEITRREFLHRTSLIGLSAAALPAGLLHKTRTVARAQGSTEVSWFLFEGPGVDVAAKEVGRRYMSKHPNVKINFVGGSNAVMYPKMVAARRTTPDNPLFNMAYINPQTAAYGDRDKMWLSLDPKNMPNLKNVVKEYRRPQNMGTPYAGGLVGLLYNKEKVKEPPTSWRDLWENPLFKKRVVLFDYLWAYNSLIIASRLNGGSEKNMDPGFEVWSKHADQILALVTSTRQMLDLMVKGDAWITCWFKGNQAVWEKEGAPIGYADPKEGSIGFPLYLEVLAGTDPEKKKISEELLNMTLDPELIKLYCESTYSTPLVEGVNLKPEMANDPAYRQETIARAMQLDWITIAKENEKWKKRWDREVKSRL